MNKKILVLAFVSVALFGCTSDYMESSSTEPPAWDGVPSVDIPSGGGGGGGGSYCKTNIIGFSYCEPLDSYYTAADCIDDGGTVVSSNSGCDYTF